MSSNMFLLLTVICFYKNEKTTNHVILHSVVYVKGVSGDLGHSLGLTSRMFVPMPVAAIISGFVPTKRLLV